MQRLERLQASIRALSTASSARIILDGRSIIAILRKATLLDYAVGPDSASENSGNGSLQEDDLEWLLVSKATTQVYGLVLKLLIDQTIPLSRDIDYWDEVLGSYRYTALYTIQTSPLRLWNWAQNIWYEAGYKLQSTEDAASEPAISTASLANRWSQYYGLVKRSIRKRSLKDMHSKLISPLIYSQSEAESKRRDLRRLRELSASALGVLVGEGMALDNDDGEFRTSRAGSDVKEEWKSVVSRNVSLMEAVLRNITVLEMSEYLIFLIRFFSHVKSANLQHARRAKILPKFRGYCKFTRNS